MALPANPTSGTGTYGDFFTQVLTQLGLPATQSNLIALSAVAHLEGLNKRFNPLNSVVKSGNSTTFNSAGVQDYKTWNNGVAGTVALLQGSRWASVRNALADGDSTTSVLAAFTSTYATWGSHVTFSPSSGSGVVNQTLGQTGGSAPDNAAPYAPGSLKPPLTNAQRLGIYNYLNSRGLGQATLNTIKGFGFTLNADGSYPTVETNIAGKAQVIAVDTLLISDYDLTASAAPGTAGFSGGQGQTSSVVNTPDWVGELGTLLSDVLNVGFWKRAGIVVIALLLLIVAIYLLVRKHTPSPEQLAKVAEVSA